MTAVEVLMAARAKVKRGWCQGHYVMENGDGEPAAYCAAGAISRSGPLDANVLAYDFFSIAVRSDTVSAWNDAPGRTQAEVLAAFDRAIALAEAEASQ